MYERYRLHAKAQLVSVCQACTTSQRDSDVRCLLGTSLRAIAAIQRTMAKQYDPWYIVAIGRCLGQVLSEPVVLLTAGLQIRSKANVLLAAVRHPMHVAVVEAVVQLGWRSGFYCTVSSAVNRLGQ
jgi:hypothetical protein